MYRRPKDLDERITDEQFEKLMDIAREESESAISFGDFHLHFERAVLAAARLMLPETASVTRTAPARTESERGED